MLAKTSSREEAADPADRSSGTCRPVLITRTVLLVALTCVAIAFGSPQGPNDSLGKPGMGYELYSWQERTGRWSFCLLPSPSGVNIRAEEVFDKKALLRGVDGLRGRISKLPVGATIYWLDGLSQEAGPRTKEVERLSYPPADIIDQLRRHAETRHIEIQMLRKNKGL
jgi:hypothetical protein